jgi:polar amino acid transport system substrate-binding protein
MRSPVVLLVPLIVLGRSAPADTLDRVLETGAITWGADEEGGGPYVYPDPANPEKLLGFEVELADMVARELSAALGRSVEARFAHGQWETLPSLLETGRIDMVLNGYEWTEERAASLLATKPYYVYELQLLASKRPDAVKGWSDLCLPPEKTVGVLGGSASERAVERRSSGGGMRAIVYDGNTSAMADTVSGKIDATLQDLPIAAFYAKEFPALHPVGEPMDPGWYVIYLRKDDARLKAALDAALESLRAKGELRGLYERWGIWTAAQEEAALREPRPADRGADTRPSFWARHGTTLIEAAGMTVFLSVISMPLAIGLGLLIALGRLYGPRILALPLAAYVEVLRGTPLMLQLFVIFFLLPAIGITLQAVPAAIAGLAINYSAYESEIYRAGLQAVPIGQMEAALALGFPRGLAIRRILVPQAFRIVIPAVTNDFIALFKDTSVCSVITVIELTKRYNIAAMNNPGDILPLAGVTAALYLAMSYPLSLLSRRMEGRLAR